MTPRVKRNQFKKGHHYSVETEFKKGSIPHNHLPVGSVVKKSNGYWEKKIAEPNVWETMHKLIWEEAHGPIPDGMVIIFLDGNIDNYQLDNLMMVSRGESAQITRFKYRSRNPKCTKIGVMSVRLSNKVKELRK